MRIKLTKDITFTDGLSEKIMDAENEIEESKIGFYSNGDLHIQINRYWARITPHDYGVLEGSVE